MSANKFTEEFKRDAVAQVEDRGYPVREVAERLGVSTKSIYTWQKQFSRPVKVIEEVDAQADEIRRLKRDLARVTEERDILKNRHGSLPACARYKQPVLPSAVWRAVADRLLEGQTPLKNVAHGLMRT
jgi:transposase